MPELKQYIRADGVVLHYLDADFVQPLLDEKQAVGQWLSAARSLKKTQKVEVALQVQGNPAFIKAYLSSGLCSAIRPDRAKAVFDISQEFLSAAVPVPQPKAYIRCGKILNYQQSLFVCEALGARVKDLKQLAVSGQLSVLIEQKNLLETIAEVMAVMHNHQLAHGDMKWSNIMVDAETAAIWLIDLDGARKTGKNNDAAAGRDLARFLINAHEQQLTDYQVEQFIERYALVRALDVGVIKQWIAAPFQKLAQRHRKKYHSDI